MPVYDDPRLTEAVPVVGEPPLKKTRLKRMKTMTPPWLAEASEAAKHIIGAHPAVTPQQQSAMVG